MVRGQQPGGRIDRVSQFPIAGTRPTVSECARRAPELNCPKVLAITKRPAELCGTQPLLHGEGFELVTATSMAVARCVIKSIALKGVIVCWGSWSEQERESIVSELAANHPEVTIIMRCPGCTGCDEASHTPGTLSDTLALSKLVSAKTSAAKT
jgi:hypothetical protein